MTRRLASPPWARRRGLAFAAWSLVGAAAVLLGAPASARAFSPIARASAMPSEVSLGEAIVFSSAGSLDPDDDPITFEWDLGDGTILSGAAPSHVYATPGAFDVTLTVSDGTGRGIATLTVYVLAPRTPSAPTASSQLAMSADGTRVWVVSPDSGSISLLDATTATLVREVPVCREPRTLALSADGSRVIVACMGSNEVVAVDAVTGVVAARRPLQQQPWGVAIVPTDGRIVVTLQGTDAVAILAPDLSVMRMIDVADGPRAIAIAWDGSRAFVSHFLTRSASATVSILDLATGTLVAVVPLVEDPGPDGPSSGRGFPNLLGTIVIEPSGRFAWVGGLKSNTERGMFRNGLPLVPPNRVRGVMARVELATGSETVARRIDMNNADRISGIAYSRSGRLAYVTHPGVGAVSIFDLVAAEEHDPSDGSPVTALSRVDVGDAPDAIVLSPDGTRAWVACFLSRTVVELDVTDPRAPRVLATVVVTADPLAPEVLLGKRMFNSSRDPEHSEDGYIACASCHPDGASDGRTWDFTQVGEGLRNTIDLRGRGGTAHGPVHWSANFDEIQDFENDIVNGFGGTGLAGDGMPPHPPLDARQNGGRSAELDALAIYLETLNTGALSPYRDPTSGALSAAALRGKATFESTSTQCTTCHRAPLYTDSVLTPDPRDFVLHDVGTLGPGSGQRLGTPLLGLDTPSLIGLWDSPPYLHDGSAATLRDVLTVRNAGDRHGVTSMLAASELDDLVAYLLSIDGRLDEPVIPSDGGVSGTDAGGSSSDGGTRLDAATMAPDAGAGSGAPVGGGCDCGVAAPRRMTIFPALAAIVLSAGMVAAWSRGVRRRRRRRP